MSGESILISKEMFLNLFSAFVAYNNLKSQDFVKAAETMPDYELEKFTQKLIEQTERNDKQCLEKN